MNAASTGQLTSLYLFEGIASSVLLGLITSAYGLYLPAWPAGPTYSNGPFGVYQVGASSLNWMAGKLRVGGSAPTTAITELLELVAGNVYITATGSTGYIDIGEYNTTTDPSAPAADRARVYVRDNGAGKEQLCVRFATGAVQVVATEP